MIYRSGSQVLYYHDYTQEQGVDLLVPGGEFQGNAVLYSSYSDLVIDQPYTGFQAVLGSFDIQGQTFQKGTYLLHLEDTVTLKLYKSTDELTSTLVQTFIRDDSLDPPFTLTLRPGTVLSYAIQTLTMQVSYRGLTPGWTLDGVEANSAGDVTFTLGAPRRTLARELKTAAGGLIEQTVMDELPGDEFYYIPPNHNPVRDGDTYRYSSSSDTLQQRIDKLDTAFVAGGLLRQTSMLTGLVYPMSSTYMQMGQITYRLDDGWGTQDFTVNIEARNTGRSRITVTCDGHTQVLELLDSAHFVGAPYGYAVASSGPAGTASQGVALERDEKGELYLYHIKDGAPGNQHRATGGEWVLLGMPYVVAGEGGFLRDKERQIRLSAGPYLYSHGNSRHAKLMILCGSGDVGPLNKIGMVVLGQLSRYAVVGTCNFDPKSALLLKGD